MGPGNSFIRKLARAEDVDRYTGISEVHDKIGEANTGSRIDRNATGRLVGGWIDDRIDGSKEAFVNAVVDLLDLVGCPTVDIGQVVSYTIVELAFETGDTAKQLTLRLCGALCFLMRAAPEQNTTRIRNELATCSVKKSVVLIDNTIMFVAKKNFS